MRFDLHTTMTADTAICMIEFENGIVGNLNAYHVTPYRHTFSLFGTKKNIYVNARFCDEGDFIFEQELNLTNEKQEVKPVYLNDLQNNTAGLCKFYEAVRKNDPEATNYRMGDEAVRTVFAAEKSAKTSKEVLMHSLNNI